MDKLSIEEKELLTLIKKEPHLQSLFFREAKGLKWFRPLQKEGFFKPENLPPPKSQGEHIRIPLWEITDYMVRVAPELNAEKDKSYHQDFISVIENATEYAKENEISNYQVWWRFAEVLFHISSDAISDEIIDAVDYWLEDKYDTNLVARAIGEKLLPELLNKQNKRTACIASKLLSKLFKVSFKPHSFAISETGQKAFLRFKDYWVKKVIEKTALKAGKRLGIDGVTVFHNELTRILKEVNRDQWSHVWQPAIEEHEQNSLHNDAENFLVLAYRDSLTGFIQTSPEEAKEYLQKMINNEYTTIQRIAIHCIGQKGKLYESFWNNIIKEKFFHNNYLHEMWHFLKSNYPFFTNEQKEGTLKIIQEKKRKDKNGNWESASAYEQSIWLASIKDHSKKEENLYQIQIQITDVEPERPDFSFYMSSGRAEIVHPVSPYTNDEINSMEIAVLVKKIKSFKGKRGWKEPSVDGLSRSLKDAIVSNPLRYFKSLQEFRGVDLTYVPSIITAYSDIWREKAKLPWDDIWLYLLQYISEVVGQKEFWDRDSNDSDSRNEVVKAIGVLIEDGARSDEHAFDEKHHDKVKDILKCLLKNQKSASFFTENGDFDAMTVAINSGRGMCVKALINVSLRHCRLADKKKDKNHTEVWKEFEQHFDTELNRNRDINYEFFTLLPEYIPNFLYMSEEWLMNNLENIFNQKNERKWRYAMQGYTYMNGFIPKVHQHLKLHGHIIRALDDKDLSERHSARFVQDIVYSFLREEEVLDDEDSLIRFLLSRGKTNEIREIILTIYPLQPKHPKKFISKIYELWPHLQKSIKENINFSSEDGGKLLITLCLWVKFIDRFDGKKKKWLLEIAPYLYSGYDFPDTLMKELARISKQQPFEVGEIFYEITIGMSKVNYGFTACKEEIKTILENLVSKGEKGILIAKKIVAKCAENGVYSLDDILTGIMKERE